MKCLPINNIDETARNESHAQYYLQLLNVENEEILLFRACLRSLSITVVSFSSSYGLTVLASPSVITALRQFPQVASLELRPRRHKLHPALRRLLRM